MEHFVITLTCPSCRRTHKYSVREQRLVGVRNSLLGKKQRVETPRIPGLGPSQSEAYEQRRKNLQSSIGNVDSMTVTISTYCPKTWKVIKVRLNKKALVEKGLIPERISLVPTSSITEPPGGP